MSQSVSDKGKQLSDSGPIIMVCHQKASGVVCKPDILGVEKCIVLGIDILGMTRG